jgi:hypothetical protein
VGAEQVTHQLLMPPHPGGFHQSSALCACGKWQWDAASRDDLFAQYRAVLRDFTAHAQQILRAIER